RSPSIKYSGNFLDLLPAPENIFNEDGKANWGNLFSDEKVVLIERNLSDPQTCYSEKDINNEYPYTCYSDLIINGTIVDAMALINRRIGSELNQKLNKYDTCLTSSADFTEYKICVFG
ncbi:hypothetical protein LCGC14_2635500, partial [marine sediment metagenome]